ncbi:MAG: Transposase [Parcubacteria group bacterium GW2011_GWB1_43_8]|nr:MAG: Transposase [Parcubacteria group bacterium GW2011_GWB1_43_8]
MRKEVFANGEFYHIFNRGVDKREIFSDNLDSKRFFQGMIEFNVIQPIGSIYENSFLRNKNKKTDTQKLVNLICYCINPNHYHFLLEQANDFGLEKFMHRLGVGYTKYFNNKYKRTGSLFQGNFKAVHVDSNEYLLHLSAYINLNHKVHHIELGNLVSKLGVPKTSLGEYMGENSENFCKKEIILNQFKTFKEYEKFAYSSLKDIVKRRAEDSVLDTLFTE